MKEITFKAFAITNEIDLNKIAIHCGIPKKFTWEQPLTLRGDNLTSILNKNVEEEQIVYVFSFGSIVFINFAQYSEIKSILNFIHSFEPVIDLDTYSDDYTLEGLGAGARLNQIFPSYPQS